MVLCQFIRKLAKDHKTQVRFRSYQKNCFSLKISNYYFHQNVLLLHFVLLTTFNIQIKYIKYKCKPLNHINRYICRCTKIMIRWSRVKVQIFQKLQQSRWAPFVVRSILNGITKNKTLQVRAFIAVALEILPNKDPVITMLKPINNGSRKITLIA